MTTSLEVKISSITDNPLEFEVEGEDLSILEILHHEILQDKRVIFAGVTCPHPLLKKGVMKVQTKEDRPIDVVIECGAKVLEKSSEILAQFKVLLKEEGK